MADTHTPGPEEQASRLYERAEGQAAKASEHLVGSRGFATVLGQLTENVAAVTKLSSDAMDLVLRNLRVAGRRDVARLGRQLVRNEDKLERVLQEVEELRDELKSPHSNGSAPPVQVMRTRASRASSARGPQRRKST